MPDNKEGFVSRWSRRKQKVAEEESLENTQEVGGSEASTEVSPEKDIDPEILKAEKLEALNKLTDKDMPDIETLNEDSDFSGFMSTSVSEGLRNMALKKLFMGKSYNIRDGLDEYDGDYTKFEKMPSTMVTSDMKHMIEVEAKKQLAKEQEEERQRMIASGEIDEFEEIDEFDEFAGEDTEFDEADTAELAPEEEYVDEYVNVDGFDTTEVDDGSDEFKEVIEKTNDNEEVA